MALITFKITPHTTAGSQIFASSLANAPAGYTTIPNNAQSAYDFFGVTGTGMPTTNYGGQVAAAITGPQSKAFALSACQQARSSLLPLVKTELFANQLAKVVPNLTNLYASCSNSLSTLSTVAADPATDATTKTALASAYAAELASYTALLNRLKTLENAVFAVGGSIDVPATATLPAVSVNSVFNATATLTVFTGIKSYIAGLLDPAVLSGNAIAALTAVTYANANTLSGYFTAANSALGTNNIVSAIQGEYLTATKQIFDTFAIMVAGFSSATISGVAPNAAGLLAGLDFELSTVGQYQTAPKAPTGSTPVLWGADNSGHTW